MLLSMPPSWRAADRAGCSGVGAGENGDGKVLFMITLMPLPSPPSKCDLERDDCANDCVNDMSSLCIVLLPSPPSRCAADRDSCSVVGGGENNRVSSLCMAVLSSPK